MIPEQIGNSAEKHFKRERKKFYLEIEYTKCETLTECDGLERAGRDIEFEDG